MWSLRCRLLLHMNRLGLLLDSMFRICLLSSIDIRRCFLLRCLNQRRCMLLLGLNFLLLCLLLSFAFLHNIGLLLGCLNRGLRR